MNWNWFRRKKEDSFERFERDMWSSFADAEADLMPPKMREEYMELRRRMKKE